MDDLLEEYQEIFDDLDAEFEDLDLRDLMGRFMKIHQDCRDEEKMEACMCSNVDSVDVLLRRIIEEKRYLFGPPRNAQDDNLDEFTIIHAEDERVIPENRFREYNLRVTYRDLNAFLDRFVTTYNIAKDNQLNRVPEEAMAIHVRTCDCSEWLQSTFTRVRKPLFNRLLSVNFPYHDLVTISLLSYAIQNDFIKKDRLIPTLHHLGARAFIYQLEPMTKTYERDRKRALRDYYANGKSEYANLMEQRFNIVIDGLQREFPLFFKNGTFDRDIWEKADPGPIFPCSSCKNHFTVRIRIVCSRNYDYPHEFCRNCLRNEEKVAQAKEVAYDYERDVIYIPCLVDSCRSRIRLTRTQQRIWHRDPYQRFFIYDLAIDDRLKKLKAESQRKQREGNCITQ